MPRKTVRTRLEEFIKKVQKSKNEKAVALVQEIAELKDNQSDLTIKKYEEQINEMNLSSELQTLLLQVLAFKRSTKGYDSLESIFQTIEEQDALAILHEVSASIHQFEVEKMQELEEKIEQLPLTQNLKEALIRYVGTKKRPEWFDKFIKQKATKSDVALKIALQMEEIELSESETEEGMKKLETEISNLDADQVTKNGLIRKLRTLQNRVERSVSEKFGSLIKQYREEKGYSLKKMEELTGISPSYINRIEKGERKAPSFKIIEKLAMALDADVNYLLTIAGVAETPTSEERNAKVYSIEELLLTNNFTINGKEANKEVRESLVSLFGRINQSNWNSQTKVKDSIEIMEQIDQYKSIQPK